MHAFLWGTGESIHWIVSVLIEAWDQEVAFSHERNKWTIMRKSSSGMLGVIGSKRDPENTGTQAPIKWGLDL